MRKFLPAAIVVLLALTGCASTYDLDKDTVVIFTFGIGFALVREKELSGETVVDADRVKIDTPYGDLEVERGDGDTE